MAIPIPDSLVLSRDKRAEKELYEQTQAWLKKEERTPGIHASSLLDPRIAYFKELHGDHTIEDKLAVTFLIGKVLHAFVLSAQAGATGTDWATDSGSKTSAELGIEYSIDRFKDGIPEELKTSRKPYEPKSVKDMDMYIEQTLIYMAAENSCVGKITVLFLSLKDEKNQTTPGYRSYRVKITPADLEVVKQYIKKTATDLKIAIEHKRPDAHKAFPPCRQFKCGPKNCKFWSECQPEGRYPKKTRGAWKQ